MKSTELQTSTTGSDNSHALSDLSSKGVEEISASLRELLADVFALYVKTKNFHWHMTGRHFRDYHLLLDDHGDQIFAMTDDIAERTRKLGGAALRSIGDIARHQRLQDNDEASSDGRGDARATAGRQPGAHQVPARHARGVRPSQRRRHCEPDRELDRRNRTADLVPLRNRQKRLVQIAGEA